MKKVIMIFFILTLLSLNSTWADENVTVQLYDSTPDSYYVLVHDTPENSDNTATAEQADSVQKNALQENTTVQDNE